MNTDVRTRDVEDLGIVVDVDVLGAKGREKPGAERLLKALGLLAQHAREEYIPWSERVAATTPAAEFDALRVSLGGDFIQLTWKTCLATPGAITRCAMMVQDLFVHALSLRLPLRGAIGVGDILYNEDEGNALGSGVDDAANWYERADAMGVIATPSCGAYVGWLAEGRGEAHERMSRIFMRYDVPLKSGGGQVKAVQMWALAWPNAHLERCRKKNQPPRKQLMALLTGFDVPPEAEQKYRHATEFYDHCVKEWEAEDARSSGPPE